MNIGIDIRIFGSENGGIGRYCQQLLPEIFKLDTTNNYFLFINTKNLSYSDLNIFDNFANVKIITTNFRHYSFREQTLFLRTLNKFNLDLTHFTNFNVPYFYKKPFVVTIHDMAHHKISGHKKSRLLHFYAYKKIIENAANKALKIITVSEYSKNDISQILNIEKNKIAVIYGAGNLNAQNGLQNLSQVKKSFLLSRPYFLFVGVLERKKNLPMLALGFDQFIKTYKSDLDLVIAGKVDLHYPGIKNKCLEISNKNRLVFTGQVTENELEGLYAGAFAFVSSSLHEGFGLPGVEALQFKLPLLVSNIQVFNEIYDNAAIFFDAKNPKDIAEKMHILERDQLFYKQMQEKSFLRSKVFSWQLAAKKTIEVYKSVLKT